MRIILVGSSGNMGRSIYRTSRLRGHEIVAGVDIIDLEDNFPVYDTIDEISIPADMVIDFSHPHLLLPTLAYCEKKHLPLIYGTTDIGEDDDDRIWELSRSVPVVRSTNFSLGMSVMKNLLLTATKLLKDNYDIEIIEKHSKKTETPDKTAEFLFDVINYGAGGNLRPVYSGNEKRKRNEVGISSVRGGNIMGEHEVLFAGDDEIIRISHGTYSNSVYATGALIAAEMILSEENGYYNMDNIAEMLMEKVSGENNVQ